MVGERVDVGSGKILLVQLAQAQAGEAQALLLGIELILEVGELPACLNTEEEEENRGDQKERRGEVR